MFCEWKQHFLRNVRYASARLHTFLTHRTVIWIYIAMKISDIFLLLFQAGQSVGWHIPGAAMNLKLFRTCTTFIIPAGQQLCFSSCTYCLVVYFHDSCPFVWCPCPMASVHAVTVRFSVISDTCFCRLLFVRWHGLCTFNTTLASCTIVQILPKYSFQSLLQVALYLKCMMTRPVSGMGGSGCRPVRRTEGGGKPTLVIWAKKNYFVIPETERINLWIALWWYTFLVVLFSMSVHSWHLKHAVL